MLDRPISQQIDDIPTWAILLELPMPDTPPSRSWMGGVPHLPPGVNWPRCPEGHPLHFFGRFDLADIRPEPTTGLRPYGLPEEGALLVFMTPKDWVDQNGHLILLDAGEAAAAVPADLPEDLADLNMGYYRLDCPTFPSWDVSLEPVFSGHELYKEWRNIGSDSGAPYVRTWADAGLFAKDALARFSHQFDNLDSQEKHLHEKLLEDSVKPEDAARYKAELRHLARIRADGPAALDRLRAWLARVEREDATGPVDRDAFEAQLKWQADLRISEPSDHMLVMQFEQMIDVRHPMTGGTDWSQVPPQHRACLAAILRRRRGHALFGPRIPPPDGSEAPDFDMRETVCTFYTDPYFFFRLLETEGVTAWLDRTDLAAARYGRCWLRVIPQGC